jgi:hypothetical protein
VIAACLTLIVEAGCLVRQPHVIRDPTVFRHAGMDVTIAEDCRVSTADSHQIVNEASLVLEKLKSSLRSICM